MAVESYVNIEEMDEMVKTLFHYHDIIDDYFVDEGFNNVRVTTFLYDGMVAIAIGANGNCIRITTVQDGEVVEIVRPKQAPFVLLVERGGNEHDAEEDLGLLNHVLSPL